ncbi:PH domain-containing protein, partial [Nanoarchaeota archaeon]
MFVFFLFYLINHYFKFKKEKYVIEKDRIVRYGGTIFSDTKTELIIKNITQVIMTLPFIENKVFKTGFVRIESAGTGVTEIVFKSVNDPDKLYQEIERIMKAGGFSLKKQKIIQQEYPKTSGVILDTLSFFIGGLVIFLVIASNVSESVSVIPLWVIILVGLLFLVIYIPYTILRFLDLKLRVYRVYDDAITYSEGFLTKNFSFIPIENLADSAINQNIIARILGIYNVVLSCQGAGREINFRNMGNGIKLEENIDKLIAKKKTVTEKKVGEKKVNEKKVHVGSDYTAQFKMDAKKTLLPVTLFGVLLFFLIFFGIIVASAFGYLLPALGIGFSVFFFTLFPLFGIFVALLVRLIAMTFIIKKN